MGELGPDDKKFRGHKHTYGRRLDEIAKEIEYCQKRGGPRTEPCGTSICRNN